MEYRPVTLGFVEFFCKTTIIPAVGKIFLTAWWLLFCKKLHETLGRSLYSMNYIYIYIIYIYLLLLYDSSNLDIEHSPYYIALGLTHTHKVI